TQVVLPSVSARRTAFTVMKRGRHFLGLFMATSGASQAVVLAAGALAGSELIGGLRGAIMLYGPLGTLAGGLAIWGLRSLSDRSATDAEVRRSSGIITLAAAAVTIVWTAAVSVLLARFRFLGDSSATALQNLPAIATGQM